MNIRNPLAASKLGLAVSLLCLPIFGWTQATATQDEIWRKANDAVGQFKRGHADVLKWEQSNSTPEVLRNPIASVFAVANAEEAMRLAWSLHLDLNTTIARMGPDALSSLVSGSWDKVDPKLIRRVEGMDELLSVAVQARKDFVAAVAAQATFEQAKEILNAAESARDLGERMVLVGNWSKLQLVPMQLAQVAAHMNVQKSQLALVLAKARLLKTLGKAGVHTTVSIPAKLPVMPEAISTEQEVQSRGSAIQEQLYYADRFVSRANVVQAYAAYQGAYASAILAQDVLKLNQLSMEETILHYNGMLKSTWDVLTQAQNQMQSATAAVNAQRDFVFAQIDLDWVLLGGEPNTFVTLGGAESAPAAAGH